MSRREKKQENQKQLIVCVKLWRKTCFSFRCHRSLTATITTFSLSGEVKVTFCFLTLTYRWIFVTNTRSCVQSLVEVKSFKTLDWILSAAVCTCSNRLILSVCEYIQSTWGASPIQTEVGVVERLKGCVENHWVGLWPTQTDTNIIKIFSNQIHVLFCSSSSAWLKSFGWGFIYRTCRSLST